MISSRSIIIERLSAIRRAVTQFGLQDKPLGATNLTHNATVRIIRNGLAVQCFNMFEGFIKVRTKEALLDISNSAVVFRFLPSKLQHAATVDAIRAIDYQLRTREKDEKVSYAQQLSASVASTSGLPMRLPDIAFFHSSANISRDQYRDALFAFGVDVPWTQVSGLSSRLGLSAFPAENVFTALAQRRHSAAHDPSAAVSESDLLQSVADAYGLAICFDILMSKAVAALVNLTALPPASFRSVKDHRQIPLRFLRPAGLGSAYAEVREGSRRSTRKASSMAVLLDDALIRTRREGGILVAYNDGGFVEDWHV